MLSSPPREASSYAPLQNSPADGDSSSRAAPNEPEKSGENQPSATNDQKDATKAGRPDSESPQGQMADGQQKASDPAPPKNTSQANASSSQSQAASSGQGQSASQGSAGKSQGSQGGKQQSSSTSEKQQQQQQQNAQQQREQQPSQQGDKQKADQQSAQQETPKTSGDSEAQKSERPASEQSSNQRQDNPSQDTMSSRMAQDLPKRWEKMPTLRPPPIASFGGIAWLVKMLLYVAVAIAVIYGLIRYWANVRSFLIAAWRELLTLWNSIFGRRQALDQIEGSTNAAQKSLRPFSSYSDPFASGAAARARPGAVVQYSFEALEAWAAERGSARLAEETPLEFAAQAGGGTSAAGRGSARPRQPLRPNCLRADRLPAMTWAACKNYGSLCGGWPCPWLERVPTRECGRSGMALHVCRVTFGIFDDP